MSPWEPSVRLFSNAKWNSGLSKMGSRTLDSKTSSFRICVEYLLGKVQTISKVNKLLISHSLPTFCWMLAIKRTMRLPQDRAAPCRTAEVPHRHRQAARTGRASWCWDKFVPIWTHSHYRSPQLTIATRWSRVRTTDSGRGQEGPVLYPNSFLYSQSSSALQSQNTPFRKGKERHQTTHEIP